MGEKKKRMAEKLLEDPTLTGREVCKTLGGGGNTVSSWGCGSDSPASGIVT